jgi:hypothetical protein
MSVHPSPLVALGPRVLLAELGAGLPVLHRRIAAAAGQSAGQREAAAMAPAFPLALSGSAVVFAREAGNVLSSRPGSAASGRDRSGLWLRNAAAGLCVLAAAAVTVSFTAQYRMVDATRHLTVVAGLEAAIPDAAALVFASLGVALALHGRRAIRARTLNLASVGTSVFMNTIAAAPGWRNLAIWAMPPIAYALASDTLIGVVRARAIACRQDLAGPDAGDTATPLAVIGGLILWLLSPRESPAGESRTQGWRTGDQRPGRCVPRRAYRHGCEYFNGYCIEPG